jgi:hypothetical protein
MALESAGAFGISFDEIRMTRQTGEATSCPPNT